MFEFRVELAEVPVLIRCRFGESRAFFRDYTTEKEPRFTVQPTDDDIEKIRADFERSDKALGVTPVKMSDAFLENNAIHSILVEKLIPENVLLMHGSALSFDGEAVIFTAKSGTGKSTHSGLWREVYGDRVVMINDDKPLLRIGNDGVFVWGTPWNGKHRLSRNVSAPLRAIVKLERDQVNRIVPMSRADAFPVLAVRCYASKDPATAVRILGMQKKLLDSVDFFVLGCNMDPDAARVCRAGIFGTDDK